MYERPRLTRSRDRADRIARTSISAGEGVSLQNLRALRDLAGIIVTPAEASPERRGFLRAVGRTAVFNGASLAASSFAGLLLAVVMSATTRGEYAAVQSWYLILHILGSLGINISVIYFVAANGAPSRYSKIGEKLVIWSGCLTGIIFAAAIPWLARGDSSFAVGYLLMLVVLPVTNVASVRMAAVQATSIRTFNRAVTIQPGLYFLGVIILIVFQDVSLKNVMVLVAATVSLQALVLRRVVRGLPQELVGDPPDRSQLLGYGLANVLGYGLAVITTRIDQVILSTIVSLRGLGQYAIAVSITTLTIPIVGTFGQIGLPQLAQSAQDFKAARVLVRRVVILSPAVAATAGGAFYLAARFFVPKVLGPDYQDVPRLVLYLLPGTVALASGNALGDILRGLGRPGLVSWAQGVGALGTVIALIVFAPDFGVAGAAVVSSVAYCVVWLIQGEMVRRVVR